MERQHSHFLFEIIVSTIRLKCLCHDKNAVVLCKWFDTDYWNKNCSVKIVYVNKKNYLVSYPTLFTNSEQSQISHMTRTFDKNQLQRPPESQRNLKNAYSCQKTPGASSTSWMCNGLPGSSLWIFVKIMCTSGMKKFWGNQSPSKNPHMSWDNTQKHKTKQNNDNISSPSKNPTSQSSLVGKAPVVLMMSLPNIYFPVLSLPATKQQQK